jgi:hypothetical protein
VHWVACFPEVTLELNKAFCKGPKVTAPFCCAWFLKAPSENIASIETDSESAWNVPRNAPQTLLAFSKATGSCTSRVSVWGRGNFC